MPDNKVTPEQFRSSLEDVIVLLRALTPHAETVHDAIGMATLALENDGQLRLLMKEVAQAVKK